MIPVQVGRFVDADARTGTLTFFVGGEFHAETGIYLISRIDPAIPAKVIERLATQDIPALLNAAAIESKN